MYEEFRLVATDFKIVKSEGKKTVKFRVQVPVSPAGELIPGETSSYDAREMRDHLAGWELQTLQWPEVIKLGSLLGNVMFPGKVQGLLINSLSITKERGKRLRIRLILESDLHNIPWEYALLNRAGGEPTKTDFLGLTPDVSLVRHQAAELPNWTITATLPVNIIVALSNALDSRPLNLAQERKAIEDAVASNANLLATYIPDATPENFLGDLTSAHLFHFAGHGDFQTQLGPEPGSVEGEGAIILDDGYGDPKWLRAGDLALRLRKLGIRVAFLGACRSGRRDNVNVWSSVATALLKADVGAVVSMQYNVLDDSAAAFAREFYDAVVSGLTIDEAVTNGRLAVAALEDVRGWGVPVVYLRANDGVLFPEFADNKQLEASRNRIRMKVTQHIDTLKGKAVGLINEGEVDDAEVVQRANVVEENAELIGIHNKKGGGDTTTKQEAKEVRGKIYGNIIDKL